ncbi:MAG: tRNA glutamyl-Q(34) synthetase GluQRS, partial [Chromatiaceae bacterium]
MATPLEPAYTGRFAPSPTGPLHFGSLVAAVISWLDARTHGGTWRVRMEDLDPPREEPGAADRILRTLDAHGLHWDGPVLYQSTRLTAYADAMQQLREQGRAYDCGCTRREIAALALQGLEGPVYPGTCREGLPAGKSPRALRVRTHDDPICFSDRAQGEVCQQLASQIGDFVIRRADGLTAYQLAVVVDDAFQGVTHVVRGIDLLASTP